MFKKKIRQKKKILRYKLLSLTEDKNCLATLLGYKGWAREGAVGRVCWSLETAEGGLLAAGLCKLNPQPWGEDLEHTEWRQLCKLQGGYL